jgi:hypothetical protein
MKSLSAKLVFFDLKDAWKSAAVFLFFLLYFGTPLRKILIQPPKSLQNG